MGKVHLVRISSKLFVFSEYFETVQSSEPTTKKSFWIGQKGDLQQPHGSRGPHRSHHGRVRVLAVVDDDGLFVRAALEDADGVALTDRHEAQSIGGVAKECRAGHVWALSARPSGYGPLTGRTPSQSRSHVERLLGATIAIGIIQEDATRLRDLIDARLSHIKPNPVRLAHAAIIILRHHDIRRLSRA